MGNAESTHTANETQPNAAASTADVNDEPWWQEIEHENLILEQRPVAVTLPQESESVPVILLAPAVDRKAEQSTERPANADEQSAIASSNSNGNSSNNNNNDNNNTELAAVAREQSLEEFKEELRSKRLARQTAVQDLRDEINSLRKQLATEQAQTRRLRQHQQQKGASEAQIDCDDDDDNAVGDGIGEDADTDDENPTQRSRHANIELANAQLALQLANADNLSLRGELDVVQKQVGTLKEVISCCKQMLTVKEEQCSQLKDKLQEIETSFSEREMKIMSNNLRQEYERQLVNIRQLRQLYEERQRVAAAEYENLQRLISIKKDELIAEQEKTKNFEERNQNLLTEVETANNELAKLRAECSEHRFEMAALKEEMGAVNMLFSQMVMGFNGKNNLDIDRLTKMLEENRDLLNEMTQAEGSCSDGATLPKLLFELVEQAGLAEGKSKSRSATPTPTPTPTLMPVAAADAVACGDVAVGEDPTDNTDTIDAAASVKPSNNIKKHRRRSAANAAAVTLKSQEHEPEIMGKVASAQEIIGNLPKVWKVLMELLSHHKIERVQFDELPAVEGGCKTPELSVSKTYIKLKDLILEKKSLVKETNRLKTLNSHLDYRLNEQEKRLSAVSLELTKTWHLVGKMQRQHRQLHTQEQILRYQLQQKRRLLHELKDELEYCRRKWAAARAKNEESQEVCDDLRREFARRKLEDANHSAESGYSDSGPQSDEETTVDSACAAASAAAVSGVDDVVVATRAAVDAVGNCRRKHLRDQFEHTRRIKRMQSTSPGRAAALAAMDGDEIVLRWNSAPPTCGWREGDDDDEEEAEQSVEQLASRNGAIPKTMHKSRTKQRSPMQQLANETVDSNMAADAAVVAGGSSGDVSGRTSRIQKLEQQCKSLIQQVLETSDNRERLEIQLCRFQDEIAPVQHAVPLDEFINRKRIERMTRASSAPATGTLTPREEEYTRKRSERLGRLEEESRQLMSRIKRTTDRGHYLKKSLDRIRRAPSREGSFESNTEEETMPAAKTPDAAETPEQTQTSSSPLTAEEQAYTARRAARIQRLEQESQQLLSQLSRNAERNNNLSSKLDTLHERQVDSQPTSANISQTVEQRLEDIERVSANRAERLRKMEAQGNELIARLSNTSERGTAMINRIAEREATRRQEALLLEQTVPTQQTTCMANNLASSRIVEEPAAACCVTVTTTPSQLAVQQQQCTGAIPKTKPLAQLCAAARRDDASKKRGLDTEAKGSEQKEVESETLENMVQRLRALPFPAGAAQQAKEEEEKEDQQQTSEVDDQTANTSKDAEHEIEHS